MKIVNTVTYVKESNNVDGEALALLFKLKPFDVKSSIKCTKKQSRRLKRIAKAHSIVVKVQQHGNAWHVFRFDKRLFLKGGRKKGTANKADKALFTGKKVVVTVKEHMRGSKLIPQQTITRTYRIKKAA